MPVLEGWKHITNDPYVLSIVSKGYRLRFTSPPLLRKAPWEIQSPKGPQKIQGMREQILYPLCFNRSNHQSTSGYSRVLLECIPGTQGISRVASSNRLKTTEKSTSPHLTFTCISSVLNMIKRANYAFQTDLQDVYFHVLIHPASSKYLSFAFENKVYQFRVLPFSLNIALSGIYSSGAHSLPRSSEDIGHSIS